MRIELYIQALERMGGLFVSYDEDKKIMKFDIPRGCRLDDDGYLKNAARLLKAGLDSDAKLLIKRVEPITPVAFEDEINAMFKIMIDSIEPIPDSQFISVRNMILRKSNMTMRTLSDSIADGIIDGYSPEMQMEKVREVLGL